MRFADTDGSLIDVYQAATQLTDESDQDIATESAVLLDNAIGAKGYYAVVTANMHTDDADSPGADAIIAAAQARGVPVVSASQMLTWLDGRDQSSFSGLSFSGGRLSFAINQGAGARGLQAMLPIERPDRALLGAGPQRPARRRSASQTIKGIAYAMFDAAAGSYVATYPAPGGPPPTTTPPRLRGQRGEQAPRAIKTVEVLSRATLAPTFPRLKISTTTLRPGGGRSLAITFRLKHTSRVVLTVRDAKGKVVRRIRVAQAQGAYGPAAALGRARQQGPLRQARALPLHPDGDRVALPEDRPRIGARPRRADLSLSPRGWRRRAPAPRWRRRCAAGSS